MSKKQHPALRKAKSPDAFSLAGTYAVHRGDLVIHLVMSGVILWLWVLLVRVYIGAIQTAGLVEPLILALLPVFAIWVIHELFVMRRLVRVLRQSVSHIDIDENGALSIWKDGDYHAVNHDAYNTITYKHEGNWVLDGAFKINVPLVTFAESTIAQPEFSLVLSRITDAETGEMLPRQAITEYLRQARQRKKYFTPTPSDEITDIPEKPKKRASGDS